MIFKRNNLCVGSRKRTAFSLCTRFLAGLGIFFLLCGEFLNNVHAASKTLMSISQAWWADTITPISKEEFINDLEGINYLTIGISNTEIHSWCDTCGAVRASSTAVLNIYGYTKEDDTEVLINTYTMAGLVGNSPRSATYQMMVTNAIKEKYSYLKAAGNISGAVCGNCEHHCGYFTNGTGYITISAKTFDNPTIQTSGNLADKEMIEGVSDNIGVISAYFPSGSESYKWQYSEGSNWVSLVDGTGEYNTVSHGTISLADKNGGYNFSSSNSLRMNNPKLEMTGIKFRAILISGNDAEDTTSSEAVITVKSKDMAGVHSVRFASRYGQVGERITTNDVIMFVKFNNGQVVEAEQLKEDSRTKYYGFIKIKSDVSGLSDNEIIEGLKNGTIEYEEVADSDDSLKIKAGNNKFYLKFAYEGTGKKNIFTSVEFEGKDEIPPVFDENVELYESDGVTLYSGKDYEISDKDISRKLKIKGTIADSVNDSSGISWAYTLTGTKNAADKKDIPVYRSGTNIEVDVTKNGIYTLLAEDVSGNTSSKIINVKAFDENDPEMEVLVNPIYKGSDKTYCNGYEIEIDASDKERLHRKPYLYKRFDSEAEAKGYNTSLTNEEDYVSGNSRTISQSGFYLIATRDAVGKTVSEVIKLPLNNEKIDTSNPEVIVIPTPVKNSQGEMSEYDIAIIDNNAIKNFVIKDASGNIVANENHTHNSECSENNCNISYHFKPTETGNYTISVTDSAGNITSASVAAVRRSIESIEITDLPDSMSVNTEISLKNLVDGSRVLLKMNDGTTDIFTGKEGIELTCKDADGNNVDKVTIGYGENVLDFVLTINKGKPDEKTLEFTRTIVGEDNVAPLPGQFEATLSDGWDGKLTNDTSKQMTLRAAGYEDDGSDTDNLIITWYKDDVEVKKAAVKDGGDLYGPFSGEEYNGSYRYTVTDEKGNFSNSTFVKVVDCWDITPPTGEVRLMPDGVSEDSKARYKQIQIVNASDDRGLAEKPYSFNGDNESSYSIVGSVVAGENASYEIYLKDAVGNVTHLKDLTLTGIDSVAPTINGYEVNEDDEGKMILHIDATDTDSEGSDNSGNLQYSVDGSNYQDSPDFEISESGTVTIYVKDETGNVTKTSTDYTDTDKPQVSAVQDETGAGVIIVTASDNVGLQRIVMEGPDGTREILQVYDGLTEDVVRKDIGKTGTYRIIATDVSGNSEETSVTVDSISAACNSSILTGLKVTPSEWTSGDVMVVAQLVDTNGLSSSPFRWNGSIPTAQPYVIMTENGTATVEICDKYGNAITTDSVTVSNIDRVSPVMAELKQTEDKNHIAVNVSDTGSGIAQITISGGPYSVEMGAVTLNGEANPEEILITLPTNGTYTVRAYDCAGNSCQRQLSVEGVTTDVPKVETKEVIKEVVKTVPVDRVVTDERVVTQDRIVTQNVEVPTPVLVPVPTPEYITKYKYLREEGEDTSKLIRGENTNNDGTDTEKLIAGNDETNDKNTETEKVTKENEISNAENTDKGEPGYRTKDGTYIAPDGYEYFGRVDPELKNSHPFKYWFKKNAERIATAMCIIALILLVCCLIMGFLLTKDYIQEQIDKRNMDRITKANK